jgi:hypothetical protein
MILLQKKSSRFVCKPILLYDDIEITKEPRHKVLLNIGVVESSTQAIKVSVSPLKMVKIILL